MKKMKFCKKIGGILLLAVSTIGMTYANTLHTLTLKLDTTQAVLDGQAYTLGVAPTIIEGRTYIEIKAIAQAVLGGKVEMLGNKKQIQVTKEDKQVIFTIGSKEVMVNGIKKVMDGKVISKDSRTLVPLKSVAKEFGIDVQFNKDGNIILTDTGIMLPSNKIPVPQFDFTKSSFIAGEQITAVETSYDEDGDAITAREWMLGTDTKKTGTTLEAVLGKPKAGTYEVSLRVKDAKGAWSGWTKRTLQITPNQAPIVQEIKTDKTSYARGESIGFEVKSTNEEWEPITAESWNYYKANNPSYKVMQKPLTFYAEGEYKVGVQLTDAYGNKSLIKEVNIHVTDKKITTEMEHRFKNLKIGQILDNFEATNYRDYGIEKNVKRTENSHKLVLSNSPEVVGAKGILYEQEIEDKGRILLHHLNNFSDAENSKSKKKIMVVVHNPGTVPVELKISNEVVLGGTSDPLILGQKVVANYFKQTPTKSYTVKPGERVAIYDSKHTTWSKGDILTGMMDFESSGELKVTIATVDRDSTADSVSKLSYLPKDVHPRGTYHTTEKYYDINLEETTPTYILLGEGADEWTTGIDVITGEISKNRGNYGITYHITITAKEDTGVILNPRGGPYRGAVRWDDGPVHLVPEVGVLSDSNRSAVIGMIPAGTTQVLEYMLPNGSASPILIGFVPKSEWGK